MLHTVSYLPAIPLDASDFLSFEVFFRVDVEAHVVSPLLVELVDKCLPHLLTLIFGEVGIEYLYVNTRYESIVKGADTVCCQEENSVIELQSSEEA